MKTYIKDKKAFMEIKSELDGQVFWRDIEEGKVEIKPVVISKMTAMILESLSNGKEEMLQ
jgi:hypothetical protein